MQEIGIESSLLQAIRDGRKTVEGRLGKPRFLKIRVGDTISVREDIWKDGKLLESYPNAATIKVTQLLYFESFAEMLSALGYKAVIPLAVDADEALRVYRTLYSAQDEHEYGVVAISFSLS